MCDECGRIKKDSDKESLLWRVTDVGRLCPECYDQYAQHLNDFKVEE